MARYRKKIDVARPVARRGTWVNVNGVISHGIATHGEVEVKTDLTNVGADDRFATAMAALAVDSPTPAPSEVEQARLEEEVEEVMYLAT